MDTYKHHKIHVIVNEFPALNYDFENNFEQFGNVATAWVYSIEIEGLELQGAFK